MTISFENGIFIVRSIFDENDILKQAGFKWNPDTKRWYSESHHVAEKLLKYCDNSAIFQIRFVKEGMQKSVLESASSEGTGKYPIYHPQAIKPFPYQIAGVEYILPRPAVILADEMGLGKEESVDNYVFTPFGRKRIGDLIIGDKIIGRDGKAYNVTGVFPQGTKELYRVTFSDGFSILVGLEHLWTVFTRNTKRNVNSYKKTNNEDYHFVLTTSQLLDTKLKLIVNGRGHNKNKEYEFSTYYIEKNNNSKWQIPIVKPIEFQNNNTLPIDPYLLGVVLGNGHIAKSHIEISSHKDDYDEVLSNYNLDKKTDKRKSNLLLGILRNKNSVFNSLGLKDARSHNKFIPNIYKYSSIDDRIALLQGLMDTDGHCMVDSRKKGNFAGTEYATVSEKLADDICELVQSLGGIARKKSKIGSYKKDGVRHICKKVYRINIKMPDGINPFRLKIKANRYVSPKKYKIARYIKNIQFEKMGEAICIKVDAPDSLYVTEHAIVTHNTGQALLTMNMRHPVEALIVCPSILKYNWLKEARKWMIGKITAYVYESKKIRLYEGRITNHNKNTILHIINYDILEKFKERLLGIPFNFFVADECFVYDTLVNTDKGLIKIGDIVEKKLDVKILSYNHETNQNEYKSINRLIKHEKQEKKLIKIKLSNGNELICTEEHKIFVNGKYTKASEIHKGDNLFMLRSEIYEAQQGEIDNSLLIDKTCSKDEIAAIKNVDVVEFVSINKTSSFFIPFNSNLLQDINNNNKIIRFEKNEYIECVRVESIEVLEQRCYGEYRKSENGNIELYDIEVNDNHNYYANSILVSNCHYIKNMDSNRSKISQELANKAKWKIFITGTPIYNKPKDLFVALNLIDPTMFSNFYQFASRYCGAKKVRVNNKSVMKYGAATNVEELNTILRANYMVRRMKKDVLKDLPEKIKDVIILNESDLDVLVQKEKKAVEDSAKEEERLKSEAEELKKLAAQDKQFEELYKNKVKSLREIKFKNFGELSRIRKEIAIKKVPYVIDFVKDMLENNEDPQSKIVIFGHHKEVLQRIYTEMRKYNPVIITGEVSDGERQRAIMQFKEKNTTRVFVGSMGAAGTGVDGLQQNCNTIVFAELDWTPSLVDQAESRLQRIGQKNTVWVYHIVANESIDSRIIKLMMEKERVSKEILDYRPEQIYEEILKKG